MKRIKFKRTTYFNTLHAIKGTASVISSDPQCTDGNARFKKVPFKPLSINNVEDIVVFLT